MECLLYDIRNVSIDAFVAPFYAYIVRFQSLLVEIRTYRQDSEVFLYRTAWVLASHS